MSQETEDGTKAVSDGIPNVLEDNTQTSSPMIQNIAVVLEQVVVLEDLPDPSTTLAYLFALNFSYPKNLKYTFDTIQNVFLELWSGIYPYPSLTRFQNKLKRFHPPRCQRWDTTYRSLWTFRVYFLRKPVPQDFRNSPLCTIASLCYRSWCCSPARR